MTDPKWRKSSYSGTNGSCVELADLGAVVLVRNSNHPDAGTLTIDGDHLAALIADVKGGRLDNHA